LGVSEKKSPDAVLRCEPKKPLALDTQTNSQKISAAMRLKLIKEEAVSVGRRSS
jgi:hypothetical protein